MSNDKTQTPMDVEKEYHKLLVTEWEIAYGRPCSVALPNAAESAALYGLERLIRKDAQRELSAAHARRDTACGSRCVAKMQQAKGRQADR